MYRHMQFKIYAQSEFACNLIKDQKIPYFSNEFFYWTEQNKCYMTKKNHLLHFFYEKK